MIHFLVIPDVLPALACRKDNLSHMFCYGSLCYYRNIATHRGHIKKIKFGPGRGNNKLAVLFSDGMDIWDLQKVFSVHLLNKCSVI